MDAKQLQEQIGRRIARLRKNWGLSQENLAKRIGMSRPSLVQLESGNRGIDVSELINLSHVLEFSLDEFLSPDFKAEEQPTKAKDSHMAEEKVEVRISVPELKVEKFKNVLLYLLEHCAGKPNVGKTMLNKLLYFCDFNFYERYEEHLTGAKYKKLPYGPVPQELNEIIDQLIDEGQLKRLTTTYHGFSQERYMPLEKADLTRLSAAEKTVIDHVIQQMSDWNAAKISDYSHQDMPWLATPEGDFISYNLAFYRELPYSVRVYDDEN